MIEELKVYGFRILNDFAWHPKEGLNILVGANSAGKSTVMDAIELVTRGSIRGQNARYALSPDWFNMQQVEDFFDALNRPDKTPEIPHITIIATFSKDPRLARIMGCNGPDGAVASAPGIFITYRVPPALHSQFIEEAMRLSRLGGPPIIPTEYYECSWRVFQGDPIIRRPSEISCSRIDASPERHSRIIDSYAQNYVKTKLEDDEVREVSSKFRRVSVQIDQDILANITVNCSDQKNLGLQIDKSPRTDWTNSVVLHREGLPLSVLGSAEQTLTKCAISLENSANESILLAEEPECHLSHTSLKMLIKMLDDATGDKRQIFVTTHSPFVLNRLGLDNLSVMANGHSPHRITELSNETVRYFRRLSGYNTLRLVLAERSVLVEGPTDEMVFAWAFRKTHGCLPEERGIDVIECGIQHRRFLELAAALDKHNVVAVRDNDGKNPDHWRQKAEDFLSEHRQFVCGDLQGGPTIEPQMINANKEHLAELALAVKSPNASDVALKSYMLDNKTKWALELLDAAATKSDVLSVPPYIREAIDIIAPKAEGGNE